MRCLFLLCLLAASATAAEVTLLLQPRWAGASIEIPSAELRNNGGQILRITRYSGLISNAALMRPDGSVVSLSGQYGFIDAANGRLAITLHDVPTGDYAGIGFQFGLTPAVNHADPGRWPAGHPLNPLVDHLHWNWQGGYVFLALEGHWRDPAQPAGAGEHGFSYHLAGD